MPKRTVVADAIAPDTRRGRPVTQASRRHEVAARIVLADAS
jgi:hypothetical protein